MTAQEILAYIPALVMIGGVGIYFVRSTADSSSAQKVQKAVDAMVEKIDKLRDTVAIMTASMQLAEERHKALDAQFALQRQTLAALETYAHQTRHDLGNQILKNQFALEALQSHYALLVPRHGAERIAS